MDGHGMRPLRFASLAPVELAKEIFRRLKDAEEEIEDENGTGTTLGRKMC